LGLLAPDETGTAGISGIAGNRATASVWSVWSVVFSAAAARTTTDHTDDTETGSVGFCGLFVRSIGGGRVQRHKTFLQGPGSLGVRVPPLLSACVFLVAVLSGCLGSDKPA